MSIYFIAGDYETAALRERFLPLGRKYGFREIGHWQIDDRTLVIIDNPENSVIQQWQDGDDFSLAIGPFLFNGHSGARALEEFHRRFDPTHNFWSGTKGHFTCILRKDRRTYIFTDGLGSHKIYHTPSYGIFSNSFLATLFASKTRNLDRDGSYIYAFAGSCYGERTFVEEVKTLPANSLVSFSATLTTTQLRSPIINDGGLGGDFHSLVEESTHLFRNVIEDWSRSFDGRARVSLSGGFDSRLILGALRKAGAAPELYTYGGPSDLDVRIAHLVAAQTGLAIRHVDKGQFPVPDPDAFPEIVEKSMMFFDGWKNTGLIDSGVDVVDRRERHLGGALPFNGGLGEVYRNFFNLRNVSYSARDIVSAFYHQFRPHWATALFDIRKYRATLAAMMNSQLDGQDRRLSCDEAQMLYPLFRGRFWTSREAEINQRFGAMVFPYLEHEVIAAAAKVPLRFKNQGRFQAEMIRRIDPELAAVPSAYGFAFSERPSWRFRLDAALSIYRPIWLRRYSSRLKPAGNPEHPPELQPALLGTILDLQFPYMAKYFRVQAIEDEDVYNRVATMEYLAQRFSFA